MYTSNTSWNALALSLALMCATLLGAQPAHVRAERFVPQSEELPHCDLVISHGGSGSVLGALAHGLPQLLLPLGADQP